MNKLRLITSVVLVLLIAAIVFSPSLKNGFNYDDDLYLKENSVIKTFSLRNIEKICTSFFAGNYQPLTILTYLFEYHFFQLNPLGYHVTNLILHLCNCLLALWLVYLLSGRLSVALITSILFAIHPLRVESVAWISERKDILYAFFFLGAVISYLYYLRKNHNLKFYCFALLLFLLSLLSKSMAVTLPLVLLFLDYFFFRKRDKIILLDKIPFFVLSLIFGTIAIFSQSLSNAIRPESLGNLSEKAMNASYAIVFYLHKIFMPVKLACLYPFPQRTEKLWAFIFLLLLLIFMAWFFRRTHTKKLVFGAGFFLITILPVLQFIPIGSTLVSDRYSYIPSLGIFYAVSEGFVWLYTRKIRYAGLLRVSLVIILITAISVLSLLTSRRCKVWKDGFGLWNDVLDKYPDFVTALNNRGYLLMEKGEYGLAFLDFKQALRLNSGYNESRYIYLNLGNLYLDIGKRQEAIATFKKALEINPRDAEVYFNLGVVYEAQGNKEDALAAYKKTIELNPSHTKACYNLAILYNNLGKKEELLSLYKEAVKNNLDYPQAYFEVGNLYSDSGRHKDAIRLYKRAIKINPEFTQAYINLGSEYCAIGKNREAIHSFQKALKLNPGLGLLHNNLAVAYYYEKRYSLAIEHCQKAQELGYKVSLKFLELLKPYRK